MRRVHLDRDIVGVDADDGGGAQGCEHRASLSQSPRGRITSRTPEGAFTRGDGVFR
ncbi:MAG: hypothetical protein NVS4B3_00680 [Gemmatimonadaceae bacterium]